MSGRLFSSLSEFESLNFIGGGMWMPGGECWLSEEEKICSLLGVDQFRTFSMAGHAMPHRQSVSQSISPQPQAWGNNIKSAAHNQTPKVVTGTCDHFRQKYIKLNFISLVSGDGTL